MGGKHFFKCLVCGRQERQNTSVKFFSVPKNSESRVKWFNCIQKPHLLDKRISTDLRVCERHFSKNMYSKCRLKKSATPDLNILQSGTSISEDGIRQNASQVTPNGAENFIYVPVNVDTQMKEVFDVAVEEADRRLTEHQSMQAFFKETEQPTTSTMLGIYKQEAVPLFEEWILPNQRSNIQAEVSIIKLKEEPLIEVFKSEPAELTDIAISKCKYPEDFMDVKNECVTPVDFVNVRNERETNDIFPEDLLMKSNQDALQYLKPLRTFLLSQKNSRALELLTHMELILEQETKSQRGAESVSGTQLTEVEKILPKQSSNNPEESKKENISIIELKEERMEEHLMEILKSESYELLNIANSKCRDSEDFMDVKIECVSPENFVSVKNEPVTNDILQDDPPIKSNQDALQRLKPVRTFLMSQENSHALELLAQMELHLVKSEIT